MSLQAFKLKPEYSGEHEDGTPVFDHGGSIALPQGRSYPVGQVLEESEGVLVVDDTNVHVHEALASYEALERTDVPETIVKVAGYEHLDKDELLDHAQRRGFSFDHQDKKAEILAALEGEEPVVVAAPEAPVPFEGYDDLGAKDVIARLASATPEEIQSVKDYEAAHQARKTVLEYEPTPPDPGPDDAVSGAGEEQ